MQEPDFRDKERHHEILNGFTNHYLIVRCGARHEGSCTEVMTEKLLTRSAA